MQTMYNLIDKRIVHTSVSYTHLDVYKRQDEEVLSLQTLELDRMTDTLVYRVFSHTLFIKGRMSAG